MKKFIISVLLLSSVLGLFGCKKAETEVLESNAAEIQESPQDAAAEEKDAALIAPLPVTVDIAELNDCIAAVSLEKGAFYTNDSGAVMMDVTVYTYDLYDMVDISLMEAGDSILLSGEEVLISSIERGENGLISINGGLDQGGFYLYTEDNTVYFELGYNDAKSYYAVGKASLPVSADFVYEDASDLEADAACFRAEDFFNDAAGIEYYFYPSNTKIRIEKGLVAEMTRVYIP